MIVLDVDVLMLCVYGTCLVHSLATLLLPFHFSFHSSWNVLRSPSLVLMGARFNLGAGL